MYDRPWSSATARSAGRQRLVDERAVQVAVRAPVDRDARPRAPGLGAPRRLAGPRGMPPLADREPRGREPRVSAKSAPLRMPSSRTWPVRRSSIELSMTQVEPRGRARRRAGAVHVGHLEVGIRRARTARRSRAGPPSASSLTSAAAPNADPPRGRARARPGAARDEPPPAERAAAEPPAGDTEPGEQARGQQARAATGTRPRTDGSSVCGPRPSSCVMRPAIEGTSRRIAPSASQAIAANARSPRATGGQRDGGERDQDRPDARRARPRGR